MTNPTPEEIAKTIQSAHVTTGAPVKTVSDIRFENFEKRLAELEKTNAELRQANAELYAFAQAQVKPAQPEVPVQTVTAGQAGTTHFPQSAQMVTTQVIDQNAIARAEAQKKRDEALYQGTIAELGYKRMTNAPSSEKKEDGM